MKRRFPDESLSTQVQWARTRKITIATFISNSEYIVYAILEDPVTKDWYEDVCQSQIHEKRRKTAASWQCIHSHSNTHKNALRPWQMWLINRFNKLVFEGWTSTLQSGSLLWKTVNRKMKWSVYLYKYFYF